MTKCSRYMSLHGGDICRCMEAMEHQRKVLNNAEHAEVSKVDVKTKQHRTRRKYPDSAHLSHSAGARHGAPVKGTRTCKFCAKVHPMKKEMCPAWGETCDLCKGLNHFKVVCSKSVHGVRQ